MSRLVPLLAGLLAILITSAAAGTERGLGAHEHGHGGLDIAIEGRQVAAEFEAPGADVVGFEHVAKSAADKAKLDAARAILADPTRLFVLPKAAGCNLTSAKIAFTSDAARKQDAASSAKAGGHKDHDKHDDKYVKKHHSEFRVAYAFDCSNTGAITRIPFPYFKTFERAEELELRVITVKGQKVFEVTRENPNIDISGMM